MINEPVLSQLNTLISLGNSPNRLVRMNENKLISLNEESLTVHTPLSEKAVTINEDCHRFLASLTEKNQELAMSIDKFEQLSDEIKAAITIDYTYKNTYSCYFNLNAQLAAITLKDAWIISSCNIEEFSPYSFGRDKLKEASRISEPKVMIQTMSYEQLVKVFYDEIYNKLISDEKILKAKNSLTEQQKNTFYIDVKTQALDNLNERIKIGPLFNRDNLSLSLLNLDEVHLIPIQKETEFLTELNYILYGLIAEELLNNIRDEYLKLARNLYLNKINNECVINLKNNAKKELASNEFYSEQKTLEEIILNIAEEKSIVLIKEIELNNKYYLTSSAPIISNEELVNTEYTYLKSVIAEALIGLSSEELTFEASTFLSKLKVKHDHTENIEMVASEENLNDEIINNQPVYCQSNITPYNANKDNVGDLEQLDSSLERANLDGSEALSKVDSEKSQCDDVFLSSDASENSETSSERLIIDESKASSEVESEESYSENVDDISSNTNENLDLSSECSTIEDAKVLSKDESETSQDTSVGYIAPVSDEDIAELENNQPKQIKVSSKLKKEIIVTKSNVSFNLKTFEKEILHAKNKKNDSSLRINLIPLKKKERQSFMFLLLGTNINAVQLIKLYYIVQRFRVISKCNIINLLKLPKELEESFFKALDDFAETKTKKNLFLIERKYNYYSLCSSDTKRYKCHKIYRDIKTISNREFRRIISRGKPDAETAALLNVSYTTFMRHKQDIYLRLNKKIKKTYGNYKSQLLEVNKNKTPWRSVDANVALKTFIKGGRAIDMMKKLKLNSLNFHRLKKNLLDNEKMIRVQQNLYVLPNKKPHFIYMLKKDISPQSIINVLNDGGTNDEMARQVHMFKHTFVRYRNELIQHGVVVEKLKNGILHYSLNPLYEKMTDCSVDNTRLKDKEKPEKKVINKTYNIKKDIPGKRFIQALLIGGSDSFISKKLNMNASAFTRYKTSLIKSQKIYEISKGVYSTKKNPITTISKKAARILSKEEIFIQILSEGGTYKYMAGKANMSLSQFTTKLRSLYDKKIIAKNKEGKYVEVSSSNHPIDGNRTKSDVSPSEVVKVINLPNKTISERANLLNMAFGTFRKYKAQLLKDGIIIQKNDRYHLRDTPAAVPTQKRKRENITTPGLSREKTPLPTLTKKLKTSASITTTNIHSKPEPKSYSYACKECKKTFKTNTQLSRHTKIHNDEKPFSCQKCTSTFRTKWNLEQHMLVHDGIKNFRCEVCDKAFTGKGNLTKHKKTHSTQNL